MDNKRTGILASMGPTLEEIDDICFALNNGVSNFRIHLGLKTRDYCKYFRNAVKSAEITKKDIAKLLRVRYATVLDKMNGKYRFYYDEALTIKKAFFPNLDIEYLFDSEENKTA